MGQTILMQVIEDFSRKDEGGRSLRAKSAWTETRWKTDEAIRKSGEATERTRTAFKIASKWADEASDRASEAFMAVQSERVANGSRSLPQKASDAQSGRRSLCS